MSTRRPHTKSRLGCLRCKSKHLKCDEILPTCGVCQRYGQICVRSVPNSVSKSAVVDQNGDISPAASYDASISPTHQLPTPCLAASTPNHRFDTPRKLFDMWEVELLHHFTVHVAEAFDMTPAFHRSVSDQVVQEGLRHDFLMHMILMVSAVHLALTDANRLTEKHQSFILAGCSDAVAAFRRQTDETTETNCDALRVFPILMVIYAMALPHINAHERDTGPDEVVGEYVHILRVHQALRVVHEQTEGLKAKDSQPWIQEEDVLDGEYIASQSDLDSARNMETSINGPHTEPRVRSVADRAAKALTTSSELKLKISFQPIIWPNMIDAEYVDLLERRNPTAMVILAHYAITLTRCSSRWWCLDWGSRLISAIAAILPSEMISGIEVPLQSIC